MRKRRRVKERRDRGERASTEGKGAVEDKIGEKKGEELKGKEGIREEGKTKRRKRKRPP